MMNRATDVVAVSAAASPLYLPWLQGVSDLAAVMLPIAGLLWLVIQIVAFVWGRRKKGKPDA